MSALMGNCVWEILQMCTVTVIVVSPDLLPKYLPEDYRADTAGYNVTHCVHVEANRPKDPVSETK